MLLKKIIACLCDKLMVQVVPELGFPWHGNNNSQCIASLPTMLRVSLRSIHSHGIHHHIVLGGHVVMVGAGRRGAHVNGLKTHSVFDLVSLGIRRRFHQVLAGVGCVY